jgi:hypothetical protein
MFLLAPLPNAVCRRWASSDDLMSETGSTVVDFGRFFTGFLVFSGLVLPVVFAHNHMIGIASMTLFLLFLVWKCCNEVVQNLNVTNWPGTNPHTAEFDRTITISITLLLLMMSALAG